MSEILEGLLEALMEALVELIVEGSLNIGTSKKGADMAVRIIALLIFVVLYGGFAAILFLFGCQAIREHHIAVGCLFISVAVAVLIGVVYLFVKKYREKRKEGQADEEYHIEDGC